LSTSYIQALLEDMAIAGIDFVLAGGVAVVLQGVSRATMDIDTAVSLEKGNLEKFLKVMTEHNMVPRAPVPAEYILDAEQRRKMIQEKNALVFTFIDHENPYKQLDIFLTETLSFEALKDDVDLFQIGKAKVKVLSKRKLIELKKLVKPQRSKDLYDIEELEKLLDDDL